MSQKRKLFNDFAKRVAALRQNSNFLKNKNNKLPPKILKKISLNTIRDVTKDNSIATRQENIDNSIDNSFTTDDSNNDAIPLKKSDDSALQNKAKQSLENPDFVFENSELKTFIERGVHKKEKRFALQDHLFYIKVEPKKDSFPLLTNILEFLESACNYLLDELKELYDLDKNNIAYMTIYQEPLINGN